MVFLAVPVSILFIGFILSAFFFRHQKKIGLAWMAAALASLFVWIWTLYLHWVPDTAFTINASANQKEAINFLLIFVLDDVSWPYMMASAAMLLILILTAPSRLNPDTSTNQWLLFLAITIISYISAASGGVWPLIFCWMIFDLIDLFSIYQHTKQVNLDSRIITTAIIRLTGTLLAATSLAMSTASARVLSQVSDSNMESFEMQTAQSALEMAAVAANNAAPENAFISQTGAVILLIACVLRIGFFPIDQPYTKMVDQFSALGSMLRITSMILVLPILGRISLSLLAPDLAVILRILITIISIVGSIGWLLSENSQDGRSYATMAIAGMAFASALSGQQHAAIIWGVSLVLTMTPLFFYNTRTRMLDILPLICCLLFSGIPFTPNAIGWFGLISAPVTAMDILFIFVPMFILAGGFKHISKLPVSSLRQMDPWMRSVYPLGFIAAIVTHLLISILTWDEQFSLGIWQASIGSLAGAILIWQLVHIIGPKSQMANLVSWGHAGVTLFWKVTSALLNIQWLIRIILLFGNVFNWLMRRLSAILESPGGLVWDILLLLMLAFSVFQGSAG